MNRHVQKHVERGQAFIREAGKKVTVSDFHGAARDLDKAKNEFDLAAAHAKKAREKFETSRFAKNAGAS